MNRFLGLCTLFLINANSLLLAQFKTVDSLNTKYLNWQNKDYYADYRVGASINRLYEETLPNLELKDTVIVAVIDGGIEVSHPDLKNAIWVNKNEIPDNNVDDDSNGYIDDICGWNFLGTSNGDIIEYENLEYTRIVRNNDTTSDIFGKAKRMYEHELLTVQRDSVKLAELEEKYWKSKRYILSKTGINVFSQTDLKQVQTIRPSVVKNKRYLKKKYKRGVSENLIEELKAETYDYLCYHLNLDFNPREMIGDDLNDLSDKAYGNNNVTGELATHGTFVAGIIGAQRSNNIGIDGICNAVKIMALRAVPTGDEYDKDIALAIKYAVDNGARVINMSFGKEFSPNKHLVDSAIRYAERHNVLLVVSAGNSSQNIDKIPSYPTKVMQDSTVANNYITVGASRMYFNQFIVSDFSNFGKTNVDLFAPGEDIISLDTNNTYNMLSGTSFASPVVSGISALLLNYYPHLTPPQIISILNQSVFTFDKPKKVWPPNGTKPKHRVSFSTLSKSGGIVNAFDAFEAANQLINE